MTQRCLPAIHPSCAGELAGLRQQVTATEEKAALDKELMTQKLVQAEREAQASLREQRAAHEEDLQRLQREKVRSAGEGWAGLCGSLSLLTVLPCLGFHICEADASHRGSGVAEKVCGSGCAYQICRVPGPKSGPNLMETRSRVGARPV